MPISAHDVKSLREKTGLGMMDCKKALEEAGGDEAKALEFLRKKGLKMAEAKKDRVAAEGVIASYVHTNSRVAAMVEVACETDFVARNGDFARLAHDLCLQVVAARPLAVRPEDLPADLVEQEKSTYRQEVEGKPAHIVDRIVEGKLQAFYQQVCLLQQPFIRDESGKETVGDVVKAAIAKLGENIVVRRFCRFQLGETAEKESGASASGEGT
jgi:elongation factor Ts